MLKQVIYMFTNMLLSINIGRYGTDMEVSSTHSSERRIQKIDSKVEHSPPPRQSPNLTTIF